MSPSNSCDEGEAARYVNLVQYCVEVIPDLKQNIQEISATTVDLHV